MTCVTISQKLAIYPDDTCNVMLIRKLRNASQFMITIKYDGDDRGSGKRKGGLSEQREVDQGAMRGCRPREQTTCDMFYANPGSLAGIDVGRRR